MNEQELRNIKKRQDKQMKELLKEKQMLEFRPNQVRIDYIEARIKRVQEMFDLIEIIENR